MSTATLELEITPDDLMTIDEVVSKWPNYFTRNELREAIRRGSISYVRKGRSTLLPRQSISEYLKNHMVKSCPRDAKPQSSNSAVTGLESSEVQTPGTDIGMTAEAKESAAAALALTILKRPKPSLQALS